MFNKKDHHLCITNNKAQYIRENGNNYVRTKQLYNTKPTCTYLSMTIPCASVSVCVVCTLIYKHL